MRGNTETALEGRTFEYQSRFTAIIKGPKRTVYTKRQASMLRQLCDDTSNTVLIENKGVSRKWVATPFWNDSIVLQWCRRIIHQMEQWEQEVKILNIDIFALLMGMQQNKKSVQEFYLFYKMTG